MTSALTEIAQSANRGVILQEAAIPIREEVKGACEILGLDPLYVANEGKLIAIVSPEDEKAALAALRRNSLGKEAAVIGEITSEHPGFVVMKTRVATVGIRGSGNILYACEGADCDPDILGEAKGIGARSAVGMMSLPGNIPVEVEAVFAIVPLDSTSK